MDLSEVWQSSFRGAEEICELSSATLPRSCGTQRTGSLAIGESHTVHLSHDCRPASPS